MFFLFGAGWVMTKTSNKSSTIANNQKSNTDSQPQQFDKTQHSIDDAASIWVVINKNRPLNPIDYVPNNLVDIGNSHKLTAQTAQSIQTLINDAKSSGHMLAVYSSYRSYERQKTVYANEVKAYGQAVADTQSAKPGYSEHQTGLAVDVGGNGCIIEDCFGNTPSGKWVAENAHKYGFIIRYPKGKESITGYKYEPWHLRYVGQGLASEMHKSNIQTLEEFFEVN